MFMHYKNYYKVARDLEMNSELRLERLRSNLTNQYEKAIQYTEKFENGSIRKSKSKIKPSKHETQQNTSRFDSIDRRENSLLSKFGNSKASPYFRKTYKEADLKKSKNQHETHKIGNESIIMSSRITLRDAIGSKTNNKPKQVTPIKDKFSSDYSDDFINEQISKLQKEIAYNNIEEMVDKSDSIIVENTKVQKKTKKKPNTVKERQIPNQEKPSIQKKTEIQQNPKIISNSKITSSESKDKTKQKQNEQKANLKQEEKPIQKIETKNIKQSQHNDDKKASIAKKKEIPTKIDTNPIEDNKNILNLEDEPVVQTKKKDLSQIKAVSLADDILHFEDYEDVDLFFKNLMKKSEDIFQRSNAQQEIKNDEKEESDEEQTPVPRKSIIQPSLLDSPDEYFHEEPKFDLIPSPHLENEKEDFYDYTDEEENDQEYNHSEEDSMDYNKSIDYPDLNVGESSEEVYVPVKQEERKSVIKSPTKEILDKYRKEKKVLVVTPSNEQLLKAEEEDEEDAPAVQPLTREERMRMMESRKAADEQLLNELLEFGMNFEEESSGSPALKSSDHGSPSDENLTDF